MLHKGARLSGGDLNQEDTSDVARLLDQFMSLVSQQVQSLSLRRAVVRSMLSCSTLHVLDERHLFVAGQKHAGMPNTTALDRKDRAFSIEEVLQAARWEFGFEDPFVLAFPADILKSTDDDRQGQLKAIADAHVESEVRRVERQMNVIQVNPIFGPAAYAVDQRLAFVLMPFTEELTKIYNSIIKPAVEEEEFGLVCRRADDLKTNRAIIQDIWKSICEARIVIADLTDLNPNVMYELGMAHTVGKETVLIYQKGGRLAVPFDLAHIRRIEYEDDALGGKTLETDLRLTIRTILAPSLKA